MYWWYFNNKIKTFPALFSVPLGKNILLSSIEAEVSTTTETCDCLKKLISWQLEAAWITRYYFEHKTCKTLLQHAQLNCGVDIKLDGKDD